MNSNVLPSSYELYSHTKICGIYKITSPSGRIYIGSSINIYKRIRSYKNGNCYGQRKLLNSILKYGWHNHILEILEECEKENLYSLETAWGYFYNVLDFKKGLNCKLPKTNEYYHTVSEETRLKMSKSGKIKIFSTSHLENMRKAQIGRKHSEETKLKMSSWQGKKIINTSTGEEFRSAKELSEFLGLSYSYTRSILNGNHKNNTTYKYA